MKKDRLVLWVLGVGVLLGGRSTYGQNPLILDQFTADPTARVFEGRVYVYPSHDIPASPGRGRANWFVMEDYHVFSSENLVDWKDHGVILNQTQVPWLRGRQSFDMWAPDCVFKNGKYYFYYSANQCVGVAVGDSPAVPFKDPLGKPLVERGQFKCQSIDPMVLVDEDGAAYLYFGQGRCNVVRLNEDMVSFPADQVRDITPPGYNEGTFVLKRKCVYYLMWSEFDTRDPRYSVAYGTGKSPMGPFEKAPDNPILKGAGGIQGAGHHSVVQIPGTDRWVIAYHRFRIPDGNGYNRETCLSPMRFDDQGRILPVDVYESAP